LHSGALIRNHPGRRLDPKEIMKGISHFAMGVAAASCFPEAVAQAAGGSPLHFILGGIAGLLPDTLDFKFYKFFVRHDMEVTPDPLRPDPGMIADGVAMAANRAVETGKPVTLKLDTIRLAADRWQSYDVTFDVPKRRVSVKYGPIVDTGGNPEPGSEPPEPLEATAPLGCKIKLDYTATTAVDILDGPMFRMIPDADCRVTPLFIPWHRQWSHSFVIALAFGLMGGLIWGPLVGLVAAAAWGTHVVADEFGYLGSNLWFPFTSKRRAGLRWMHSQEVFGNLAAVWLSCLVIFMNLDRAMPPEAVHMNPVKLVVYGGVLPLGLVLLLRRMLRKGSGIRPSGCQGQTLGGRM
jgi:membrane-bound metal-dependent hydrolase YbcI (DUF457 family)